MENSMFSQDARQTQRPIQMSSFGPNTSNKHRSLSPSNRRNSTTAFESTSARSFSRGDSSPPNRRFSNPTNQTAYASKSASCSRSRSPSDSQYVGGSGGVKVSERRFSQPASYNSMFATNSGETGEDPFERRSLASKEKESYSSLTYLPEVRAYLKFMEDDIPLPHRSKSFNGRNSSRRSSYNRRKRSKSRTRTPTPTPMDYEDDCFQKQFLFEKAEAKSYGRFLTPQRSLEPSANTSRSQKSNSIDFTDINSAARYLRQDAEQLTFSDEMLPRRRSGSIIRTSFI